jgi:hypothetical protein
MNTKPEKTALQVLSVDEFLKQWVPSEDRGLTPIAMDKTPVPVLGDPLGEMWWRGRQWAVTDHGIERLDGLYFIAADRLAEKILVHGWPAHMTEKSWTDTEDFLTAWLIALPLHSDTIPKSDRKLLTPANIREAIARSHPCRTDDASGIERLHYRQWNRCTKVSRSRRRKYFR